MNTTPKFTESEIHSLVNRIEHFAFTGGIWYAWIRADGENPNTNPRYLELQIALQSAKEELGELLGFAL